MNEIDTLIARAEATIRLWDLVLFTTGTHNARMKRADILHEALTNLAAATGVVKVSRPQT